MTPTTRVATPSTRIVRPTTSSAPAKVAAQSPAPITATGVAPGRSSSATRSRPRIAGRPSSVNMLAVTCAPCTRAVARSPSTRVTAVTAKAAKSSKLRLSSRQVWNSGHDAKARRPSASMLPRTITRAGSRNGGVAQAMAVTTPATATAPPMPIVRAATTAAENHGSARSRRPPSARSRPSASSPGSPAWARWVSAMASGRPKSRWAARCAAAGDSPRRSCSAASASRWAAISSRSRASLRRAVTRPTIRAIHTRRLAIIYSWPSRRPTIATVRAQRSCSALSCRRPAAVSA